MHSYGSYLVQYWLYGGIVSSNFLSDTWRFDGTNWAFWAGSTSTNEPPVYGDPKTFSFDYHPGGRDHISVAVTSSGSAAYIVGGRINGGFSGDIWKFEGDKGWAYWGGIFGNHATNPGTIRVPSETNALGARYGVMSVVDDLDHLWIFGGSGQVPGVGSGTYPQQCIIYSCRQFEYFLDARSIKFCLDVRYCR